MNPLTHLAELFGRHPQGKLQQAVQCFCELRLLPGVAQQQQLQQPPLCFHGADARVLVQGGAAQEAGEDGDKLVDWDGGFGRCRKPCWDVHLLLLQDDGAGRCCGCCCCFCAGAEG